MMNNVNRKVKRPNKERELIRKLGEDAYNWSFNIQTQPIPSWLEAFEYAYDLGFNRGKQYTKIIQKAAGEIMKEQILILKKLED